MQLFGANKLIKGVLDYQVTGIYRAMSVRIGPTQRTVKSLFKVSSLFFLPFLCFLEFFEALVGASLWNCEKLTTP